MNRPRPQDELPAVAKAFDLVKEITARARKLPRDLKQALGDRMLAGSYEVLDLLIEAKYSREKQAALRRANVLLERLRFQVRLCMEERLISLKQYEYLAGMIQEVGRMVGGWLRAASRPQGPRAGAETAREGGGGRSGPAVNE